MAGYLPNSSYFNIVHVLEHADRADRPSTVTYTVQNAGSYTPNGVAAACHDQFITYWGAFMDSQVTFRSTLAYQGPTPSSTAGVKNDTATGSTSNAKAPANVALLIHKQTALIGRRNRGRMYIPYVLNETTIDEVGNVLPASVTSFTNQAQGLVTALETVDVPMYLAHSSPGLGSPEKVTAAYADPVIGTQRRRVRR